MTTNQSKDVSNDEPPVSQPERGEQFNSGDPKSAAHVETTAAHNEADGCPVPHDSLLFKLGKKYKDFKSWLSWGTESDEEMVMRFHTTYDEIAEQAPPRRAEKPEWYRNTSIMSSEYDRVGGEEQNPGGARTIKACPSFQDILGEGFVVPFWADFEVEVHRDGTINAVSPDDKLGVSFHGRETMGEMGDYLIDSGYAPKSVKFNCPWKIDTDVGIGCRVADPQFNYGAPFRIVDGIVNTGYFKEMQVNTFFKLPTSQKVARYKLERGDPFFRAIPFVRRESEAEVHVRNDSFWDKYRRTFPEVHTRLRSSFEYRQKDPLKDD